jgi:hypothetical protein
MKKRWRNNAINKEELANLRKIKGVALPGVPFTQYLIISVVFN